MSSTVSTSKRLADPHAASLEQHFALPAGTLSVGRSVATMLTDQIFAMVGHWPDLSTPAVFGRLLAAGLLDSVSAERPVAVDGGHVHADLLPEDASLFNVILEAERHAGAEAVAQLAQECRLAVTPYQPRTLVVRRTLADPVTPSATGHNIRSSRRPVIIDMTTMWAGPLCTAVLNELGAVVIRIEPACRPDGLRSTPQLHKSLHHTDEVVDLDLRKAGDRALFDQLLRHADLLVESFSERVLPNLGYGPDKIEALNRRLCHLAIRAFPSRSDRSGWVAYGGGVHAASGLGVVAGRPTPAAFAYLDPLTGLRAAATALSLLSGTCGGQRATVSLAGSAALVRADPGANDPGPDLGPGSGSSIDELELLRRSLSEPLWDEGFALW